MATFGGLGDAQDGPIDEGRRVGRPQQQPRGFRPLLGPRSCSEALERHRAGLTTPTDGPVDERAARRADEALGAAIANTSVRFFAYMAHLNLLLYM